MIQTEAQMLDEFITLNNIATEQEVTLVTEINGYNEKAMLDIIYCRTGYRSYEQCMDDGGFTGTDELDDYYGLNDEEEDEDEIEDNDED